MKIIERIFDELEKQNKKEIEIARRLGVTTAQISMWKKRKTDPPAKYIKQIAELLGVSTDYLLTGEREKRENGKDGFEIPAFNAPKKAAEINKLFDTNNAFPSYAAYIFEARNELCFLNDLLLNTTDDSGELGIFSAFVFKQCVISLFSVAKIIAFENEFRDASEIFLKNPCIKEKYDEFIFNWKKSQNREFFENLRSYILNDDKNIYFDEYIKNFDIAALNEFNGGLYSFGASSFFAAAAEIYKRAYKTKASDYKKIIALSKNKLKLFIGEALDLTDVVCREFFENYSVEKENETGKYVITLSDSIPYIKPEKQILKICSESDDYTEAHKAAYGGSQIGGKNPGFDKYKIIAELTDNDE